jgi:hypothetical protein
VATNKPVKNSSGPRGKVLKDDSSTARRPTLSVISLADKQIVRSIFRTISHATGAHQDLRRKMFGEIAKSPKLQHMILEVLAKHPDVQTNLLQELATTPRLKRKFLGLAETPRSGKSPS